MIIANTIVLGMTQKDDDKNFVNLLELLNLLFFGFFVFELLSKLIGEGFKFYLREQFNWFDSAVVLLSAVDIIIVYSVKMTYDGKITFINKIIKIG
jgi:hypothetical protein